MAKKLAEDDMKGESLNGLYYVSQHWQAEALNHRNVHVFVLRPFSDSGFSFSFGLLILNHVR